METLRYVLLTNGLLAVVTIAFYVLLRRETFFGANRLALWLGLTASLVLPLLRIPDWRPQPVRAVMQRTAQVIVPRVLPGSPGPQSDVTITFPNGHTYTAFPAGRTPGFTWSWQTGLIALYAAGVLLLLIRLGNQFMSLRRLIRQSEHDEYDDFTLVRNERVQSPFSFFGWVVLNPACHAPDELEQILRHERVHVRERHSFDMIGAELVCIVFWFNPAAYLFRYLLHQTLEFAADRAVLAEGVDARAYQYNLVKVSLSSGQSQLSNSFSKSFLKYRIAMINRPNSTAATWLNYPVLVLATLTVAMLFARSKAHTLAEFMPPPTAQVVASVIGTKPIDTSAQEITEVPMQKPYEALYEQMPTTNRTISADSVQRPAVATIPAPKSPSRYMQYEGDRLYWIITPKTSFDDLAIMKQEFERNSYKMKIQALKYDPLDSYLTEIKATIIRPIVGISDFEDTGVDGKPIRSHGGFNGLNKLNDVAVVWSSPFNENFLKLPQGLLQTVRDDERSVATFTQANRMKDRIATGEKLNRTHPPVSISAEPKRIATEDSIAVAQRIRDANMEEMILDGKRRYGHLGIGPRRFNKEEIISINKSFPNGHLSIDSNGFLSVDKAVDFVKVFINNEPTTPEDIRKITINKLYALAVIYGPESAVDKRAGTRYLLFYVDKDN